MKTLWLRSIIRRYGAAGVLFVGAVLLLHHVWHRKRAFLVGLALVLPFAFASVRHNSACRLTGVFLPAPASFDSDVAPTSYTLTDLGALPDCKYSIPTKINNAGQIVGYSITERGGARAFLWQNGKMRDLGNLGGKTSLALGVNNRGQVVGWSVTGQRTIRGFLWQNGKMQDLGCLGGAFSFADAINNRSEITGSAQTKERNLVAFLWRNGEMKRLEPFDPDDFTTAESINDRGDIVGDTYPDWSAIKGYLYRDGKVSHIPTLGGENNFASAINNRGQVVGASEVKPNTWEPLHAFVWDSGKPTDLGTLGGPDSFPSDINDNGLVVGAAQTARMEVHACLWRHGKITDLNKFVPSNWMLLRAMSVNTRGQIVGVGGSRGQYRAFLLTPRQSSARETEADANAPHTDGFNSESDIPSVDNILMGDLLLPENVIPYDALFKWSPLPMVYVDGKWDIIGLRPL